MTKGRPEFATNDPWSQQTVAAEVNEMLAFEAHRDDRTVAIASAYFNVGGWQLISDELKRVGTVRILLGAEPQRHTDPVVLRPGTVPATKADAVALAEALKEQGEAIAAERDLVPFSAEARSTVSDMIDWLRSGKVEVRRYTKEFLHGKAYMIDNPELGVIAGSSNFTYAGLAKNRELNLGQYNQHTIGAVKTWFDNLWTDADAFDLAAFYEQQVLPEEPWYVFLRMLWEAYGSQMADEKAVDTDPSMRNLLPFQRDGVGRARRILERHNGVLIADEVGLGKTYVGGALLKDTVRARQRVLIVAPKIIRDSVWRPYVDVEHLGGWVDVISYDDLLADVTPDGKRWRLDVAREPDDYSLVLLDEAHTVRNTDTGRAQALVEILKGNPRKQVVLLTATPVNNALGDLHSLLSYFIVHDDEFAEIGIPSLAGHFKAIDRLNPDDLSPEHLFDILDAVAVRRTRKFVRQNYKGQRLDQTGATIRFPEPLVHRVDYDLSGVLAGFFTKFAHALGADRDPDEPDPFYSGDIPTGGLTTLDAERLTLAGYTPSRYQVTDVDDRQRAAEVQVAGLLRSGLLKRFESSGAAFTSTCRKMADTLGGLLTLIDNEGLVASGESLRDWIRVDLDDMVSIDQWRETADYSPVEQFAVEALNADISSDIDLLRAMADTVEAAMAPDPAAPGARRDPKLVALTDTLATILARAEQDAALRAVATISPDPLAVAIRDRDDRKVLVFSYFADTVNYLQDHIDEVLDDARLAPYRGRVAFVTGTVRKTPGHGALAGTVAQDAAVAGFAPRTGGSRDSAGNPISEDLYDLLLSTDVLSEGVNLQQAHNIINYDLPWNPMRIVQRHGRVDRIGSEHDYIHLYCFFPDKDLDRLLRLETTLHRKLIKAVKSIGQGTVLPGVDGSDDVVFNAKNKRIQDLADGDASLFLGTAGNLISGEEFRAMLRQAIHDESFEHRLAAMPWGIGSGFPIEAGEDPGFVFCARILNRADEPVFRYIPVPHHRLLNPVPVEAEPLAALDPERVTIDGVPVDILTDSLTALTKATPPAPGTPAFLPNEWVELAYKAWAVAQEHIVTTWNDSLDTAGRAELAPAIRTAVMHLNTHGHHRNREDVDAAIKVYRRGQASRVTNIVRALMRDDSLTDRIKTDRLIELIDELGLTAPEAREKRYAISVGDVHLIAWMGLVPETVTVPAPEV